jgi:hypothetical protein
MLGLGNAPIDLAPDEAGIPNNAIQPGGVLFLDFPTAKAHHPGDARLKQKSECSVNGVSDTLGRGSFPAFRGQRMRMVVWALHALRVSHRFSG